MAFALFFTFLAVVILSPFFLFFWARGFRYYCLICVAIYFVYRYLTQNDWVVGILMAAAVWQLFAGWFQFSDRFPDHKNEEKKTAASGGKTAETDCVSAKAEDVLLVLNALNQDAEAPEKTSYADEPSEAPWDDQL